jgi:hypothetical protein
MKVKLLYNFLTTKTFIWGKTNVLGRPLSGRKGEEKVPSLQSKGQSVRSFPETTFRRVQGQRPKTYTFTI